MTQKCDFDGKLMLKMEIQTKKNPKVMKNRKNLVIKNLFLFILQIVLFKF